MSRKQVFNFLKIVISALLLGFIFSTLDLPGFWAVVRQANLWWLLAALTTIMLGVYLRAVRWHILLTAIGVWVSVTELTAIYFVGFLFNNLLPSGLGGDAIRMAELNRHTEHGFDAVTSVVVDRFLGLSSLQAIALVALLFDWGAVPPALAYFTVLMFGGGLVVGYLLINQALYQQLQARIGLFRRMTEVRLIDNLFASFQRYPLWAIGKAYLVSLLFNVSLIFTNVFVGQALGAQASLVQYAVFVPITSLVLLIPISFAGLGVREETYRQLFSQVGVPAEIAVAMSLLYYVLGNVCTGLVGGIIFFMRSARDMAASNEP